MFSDAIPSKGNDFIESSSPKEDGITIIAEPVDVVGSINLYINISAKVKAEKPIFQWFNKYGTPILNQCKGNITIGPISDDDFGFYRLQITDEKSNETKLTRWAELKEFQKPEFKLQYPFQPQGQRSDYIQPELEPKVLTEPIGGAFKKGERITLLAHFENARDYQWYKDGVKLAGCNGNTLIINNAYPMNAGEFELVAKNGSTFRSVKTTVIIY